MVKSWRLGFHLTTFISDKTGLLRKLLQLSLSRILLYDTTIRRENNRQPDQFKNEHDLPTANLPDFVQGLFTQIASSSNRYIFWKHVRLRSAVRERFCLQQTQSSSENQLTTTFSKGTHRIFNHASYSPHRPSIYSSIFSSACFRASMLASWKPQKGSHFE